MSRVVGRVVDGRYRCETHQKNESESEEQRKRSEGIQESVHAQIVAGTILPVIPASREHESRFKLFPTAHLFGY